MNLNWQKAVTQSGVRVGNVNEFICAVVIIDDGFDSRWIEGLTNLIRYLRVLVNDLIGVSKWVNSERQIRLTIRIVHIIPLPIESDEIENILTAIGVTKPEAVGTVSIRDCSVWSSFSLTRRWEVRIWVKCQFLDFDPAARIGGSGRSRSDLVDADGAVSTVDERFHLTI